MQRLITQTGPEVADGCNFKLERRVNEISSLVASFPRDQSSAAGHVSRTQSAKLSISRSQVRTNEPQMYRAATFFLPRERKEGKKRDREKKGAEGKLGNRSRRRELNVRKIVRQSPAKDDARTILRHQ